MGKRKGGRFGGDEEGHFDQYGACGASQDRDEHFSGPSRGFRGGGSAGGPTRSGANVTYQRHIPKFLQPYADLLEKRKKPRHTVVSVEQEQEEEKQDAEDHEAEAIRRALEENPELAEDVGEELVRKAEASGEKEAGNTAYAKRNYEEAIKHFTKCIELDPKNEVYFSNRSASHAQMKNFDLSLRDAQSVIRLKPNWLKGWARLAAAHFGLEEFPQAKEAYQKALEIEPEDETLKQGYDKADAMERKQVRDNKHTFIKRSHREIGRRSRDRKKGRSTQKNEEKKSVKLSFED
ncbi:hypothetical protein BSKO_02132 [Bryopsis sp. KO-2023]|nr:hypothetical protein BSKO_02132 [Bryopsis sp. KO-2023]